MRAIVLVTSLSSLVAHATTLTITPAEAGLTKGSLDKEIIQRVIREHLGEVEACYEQDLRDAPTLTGRVVIDFDILPSGAVGAAVVDSTTFGARTTPVCTASAVASWVFPKPQKGHIQVRYPFELKTERGGSAFGPTSAAGLGSLAVEAIVQQHFADTAGCGDGSATIAWTIASDGKVSAIDADDDPKSACLRTRIGAWKFPRAHAPTRVSRAFR